MKKYFLLLAGFILLAFTACQNDELVNGGNGSPVAVSFKVQIPEGNSPSTRTEAGGTKTAGDGSEVNRCIMEIYLNGEIYGERQVAAVTDKKATFDVRLVTSQTYNFVFWADNVASTESSGIGTDNHYVTTNGLDEISVKTDGYKGSSKDDTHDAFFFTMEKQVTNAFSLSVELARPFGQLNIKTDDIDYIKKNTTTDLTPVKAKLEFENVYTGFNAVTGQLISGTTNVSYSEAADLVDAAGKLTVDYLLAPEGVTAEGKPRQHLANMKLLVYNAAGTEITTKELNNIPIQRNYKTNVSGYLLTGKADLNVTVVPTFTGPAEEHKVKECATTEELNTALTDHDNVVLTAVPATGTEVAITLPKTQKANRAVSITLPAKVEKTVTISYSSTETSGTVPPKVLAITAPETSKLVIDAKETTVYLNGTKYTEIEAGTAAHTLVINAGVEVTTLKVNAGNVKVIGNGKIGTISKADSLSGKTVYIIASTEAQLPDSTTLATAGFEVIASEGAAEMKTAFAAGRSYKLTEDVDITNSSVAVPAGKTVTLDLNGYTITADNLAGGLVVSGKLTIKDSKGNGKIIANKDYNETTGCVNSLISATGENAGITMEGGSIYAVRNDAVNKGHFGVGVYDGADFTMTGGKIEAGWYAVAGNGNCKTQNSVINISGGTLISTADYALYLPQAGATTITGGTITGACGAIGMRNGSLTVKDNAMLVSEGTGSTGDWKDGTSQMGNAVINIGSGKKNTYGDCNVTIEGGTFTASGNATVLAKQAAPKNTITVNVKGGTFSDPSMFGHLAESADVKVKLTKNYEGPGLGIYENDESTHKMNGKDATVEVDMNNHSWLLTDEPLFGSAGTVSQYFHLERGATVIFKNGTLQLINSNSGRMMIQNYCNLTLDNVKVIGGSLCSYVVSNNNGSCTITGSTITAAAGKVAFDVYSSSSKAYENGVTVTVNNGSVINGKVEFGGDSGKKNGKLIINGGTFNGNLIVNPAYYDSTNPNITINGGEFGNYTGWSTYKK